MRNSYQHPVAATEAGSHHWARQELLLERPTGTVRGRQDSPMRLAGTRGNQEHWSALESWTACGEIILANFDMQRSILSNVL